MMHSKVVGVVFLGLVCLASVEGIRLQKSSARARSSSSSSGFSASSADVIVADAVSEAIARGRGSGTARAVARSAAKEIGLLYAKAVAKTSGHVEVKGNGRADVKASAHAEATASLIAAAVAKGFAAAISKAGGHPSDFDAARKSRVAAILVRAHASADLELSSTGGSASGQVTAISESFAVVFVEAASRALAFVAKHHAGARVRNKADIRVLEDTRSDVSTRVDTKANNRGSSRGRANGEAEASVEKERIPHCNDDYDLRHCCTGQAVYRGKCYGVFTKIDYGSGPLWANGSERCRCYH